MNKVNGKYFSLDTKEGSIHLIKLLIGIILVCSMFAALISSGGGRIKIEQNMIDVRGATLAGELYYKAGTTNRDKYPAVVVIPGAGCTNYNMRSFAEELAKRGYVVFNINAYGSGYSETPVYNENDQGPDGYNIFATPMGVLDAVHYLRTIEFVDNSSIGVIGHSQGSRRAGYTAIMDCGYLSFNDIMLNVLHDTFGLVLTESDISLDADQIAQAKLNADQIIFYKKLKADYVKDYEAMLRSICLVGSTAQFVNPTSKVKVAGIEVTRTCKVNMAVVNGTFDFSYLGFNNADTTKEAWYIDLPRNIVPGTYYSLNDVNSTSQVVGTFRKDTVNGNSALKKAIADRSLRTVIETREDHPRNFLSSQTTAIVIDYFNQTLNHNADVAITEKSSIVFMWREWLNFIALLAMIYMLFPIIKLMTMIPKYADCAINAETSIPTKNRKLSIVFVVIGTLVLNYFALYLTNAGKNPISFSISPFFPLMITAWSSYNLLVWMVIAAVIVTVLYLVFTNGYKSFVEYLLRNISIGIKNIMKSVMIAVVFIACGYLMLSIIQYWFFQDFRLWTIAFSPMKAEHWFIALRYFILALPFYFITSMTTNYIADATIGKQSQSKDILMTVLLSSVSIWFLCALTNFLSYSGIKTDGVFSSFMTTYGVIIFFPLTSFISRKAYLITKTIWIGVFVNSMLLAWSLVSFSGTNASYVPQTWLSNFLGI